MPRSKKNINELKDIGFEMKLPPQAIEIEEAVLGALLIDSEACHSVVDILKPEHFYSEKNRLVYEAILRLYEKLQKIDILAVKKELERTKDLEKIEGGANYLVNLTKNVATSAHVNMHASLLIQKYLLRELIRISNEVQRKSYEDEEDVSEIIDYAQNELFNLTVGNVRKEPQKVIDVVRELMDNIDELRKRENKLTGVPSGFVDLDRLTGGWQNSDLIIIAARPGMGKSSFLISMLRNIAVDYDIPVAFFCLEMPASQIVLRLLSMESEIDSIKLRNANLTPQELLVLEEKIKVFENAKIFIDDTPALSIGTLRAKARRLVSKENVKLIMIDYLQLMTLGSKEKYNMTREQEVSTISRSLKVLAKDLNVPIIAISSLNRAIETRSATHRVPQLSDLRESGSIEQDADIVIFIHRPEKFGIDYDENGEPTKNLANIIIAKHRNGPVGTIKLKFFEKYTKFTDFNVDFSSVKEFVTIPSKMNDTDFMENDIF